MNQQHPLANKRHITFADLDGQTIVSKGRAYSCFRNMIDKYVLGLNRKIHILVETTDESVIRDLLIKNKAIYLGYDYMNTLWSHPEVISRPLVDSGHEGNICTPVSKANAQPGDLIFFVGTYDTPGVSHVGIYVGGGVMIHCGDPIQYTSINSSYWQQHFYAFGRPAY